MVNSSLRGQEKLYFYYLSQGYTPIGRSPWASIRCSFRAF